VGKELERIDLGTRIREIAKQAMVRYGFWKTAKTPG
jgi:hypothetical protein